MSLFPLSYHNLKRATTFQRRRGIGSTPRLGQTPPHFKTVRAGRRRRTRESSLLRFHRLAWPGVLILVVGVLVHGGQAVDYPWSSKVAFAFFPSLWLSISLVFTCRAICAVDRRSIRILAAAVNLLYPAYFALLLAGA